MKIAVCDDDSIYIDALTAGIRSWEQRHHVSVQTDAFRSGKALLTAVSHTAYDLCFLDIDLGEDMNGYDLAGKIRKIHPDASLVFVTNYDTYLKEGYELGILRYFNKPVPLNKLFDVLDLCYEKARSAGKKDEIFRLSDTEKGIPVSQILYIEYFNHSITVHLRSGVQNRRISESLSEILELLPKDRFLRVHKSYLVNIEAVSRFSSSFIYLDDGQEIPIGRSYRETVHQVLRRYFTGEKS